jgi:glycosyltransferase involved in cell wall biosynthesis
MADAPSVSIVIPAYNASATVRASVDSVLAQAVEDLEVIVVDDGSKDDTTEVARAIDDPRVKVIEQRNAGPSAARNAGLAAARGRYVGFLDADDLWLPTKLVRQLHWLDAHPDVKAVQTGVFFVNDALEVVSVRRCRPSHDPLLQTLRFQNLPAFPSTVVAERSCLMEIGGFDTSLAILEDWNLALQLALRGNLGSIEEPLALYRVHESNRSRDLQLHVEPGYTILGRLFAPGSDLPEHIRAQERRIYARFYSMLAGGAYRNRDWAQLLVWAAKALRSDPRIAAYMAALPLRRFQRSKRSAPRAAGGTPDRAYARQGS